MGLAAEIGKKVISKKLSEPKKVSKETKQTKSSHEKRVSQAKDLESRVTGTLDTTKELDNGYQI